MGTSPPPDRQAVTADDLHSQDVLSQRREPVDDARLDLSQPAEEAVRRGEGIESSEPVPQQEMSLRDLASTGSASQPASNDDMGKFDQEPPTSKSTGQAGSDKTPSQLSFTPQQQQQHQPTQQLRQQPSGNPFQAAAMAADAPAGDELHGRFAGIPTAASTMLASPDNPFASPAATVDARQTLVGGSTFSGRELGPDTSSRSHSGAIAIPHQQSGTLSVPEQHQELSGDNAVPVPCSSMHTATSIAELLADLPPAGMSFHSVQY